MRRRRRFWSWGEKRGEANKGERRSYASNPEKFPCNGPGTFQPTYLGSQRSRRVSGECRRVTRMDSALGLSVAPGLWLLPFIGGGCGARMRMFVASLRIVGSLDRFSLNGTFGHLRIRFSYLIAGGRKRGGVVGVRHWEESLFHFAVRFDQARLPAFSFFDSLDGLIDLLPIRSAGPHRRAGDHRRRAPPVRRICAARHAQSTDDNAYLDFHFTMIFRSAKRVALKCARSALSSEVFMT